jgi:hypothetical protein
MAYFSVENCTLNDHLPKTKKGWARAYRDINRVVNSKNTRKNARICEGHRRSTAVVCLERASLTAVWSICGRKNDTPQKTSKRKRTKVLKAPYEA